MTKYIDYPNRKEWLKGRIHSLGASEVASALGMGFQTPTDLYKVKTGKVLQKDLSENERVKYGNEAEDCIRRLFAIKYAKEYRVEYNPYRVYLSENKVLSATLDGELTRLYDGAKGILEIKTVWINQKKELDEWDRRVKQAYYVQVCSQLAVTKYDFAYVYAELIFPDGTSELRPYLIERNEQVENDIKYVETEAVKWWNEYVVKDKKPPVRLNI